MSSAFRGNDDDQDSPGNEEKMYPTADWVKFALDLPTEDERQIGKTWNYFTAGVVITAAAFGKPYAHPQANKIMEKYILPAVTER